MAAIRCSRFIYEMTTVELPTSAAQPALRAAVSHALRREKGLPSNPKQLFEPVAPELVALHRVDLLLTNHQETLKFPENSAERIKTQALAHTVAGLQLIAQSAEVSDLFKNSGIDFLLYKGIALSLATGRGSATRGAGDVDVLIAAEDVPKVHQLLVDEGFIPKIAFAPQPGALWKLWSYREREASYHRGRTSIDLHWRTAKDPRHSPSTNTMLARKATVLAGETALPTLDSGDALCVAATTAYLDYCQNLRLIVDLVFLSGLPGVTLPEDLPEPGRALVSDMLEFTRQLLGPDLVPQVPGSIQANPKGVLYLIGLWNHNSGGSLLAAGPTTGQSEVQGRFDHWMRYGSGLSTALRFISWAAFSFPDYTPAKPSTSFAEALGHRAKQVLTRDFPYLRERNRAKASGGG